VTRVAIVDDHPAILAAIGAAIAPNPGLEVSGSAQTIAGAIALIETTDPDVVVCDLSLGGELAGLDLVRRFGRSGRPRILVLSGFTQPALVRAAFDAGAAGFIPKDLDVAEIVASVVAVAAGELRFPPGAGDLLATAQRPPSGRELQAISLVADGATNDEIAARLGISVKTVESHLRRLFARYGLLSRTELALLAVREGWIASP
jgi:DNA-binding NarL/FixJ family response regulator